MSQDHFDLLMKIIELGVTASKGESLSALIDLRVDKTGVHCTVDPRGGFLVAEETARERDRRDARIVAREVIEGALLSLDRLDYVTHDEDVRGLFGHVRTALVAVRSKIKERIDG